LQSCRKTKSPPFVFSEGGLLKLVLNPSCSFAVAPEKSVYRHITRFLDDWQHENSDIKSAGLGLSSFDCSDPRADPNKSMARHCAGKQKDWRREWDSNPALFNKINSLGGANGTSNLEK